MLISGATGFIGQALVRTLSRQGAEVRLLTRDPTKSTALARLPGVTAVAPAQWAAALAGTTAVVNLAGAPITTRWSDSVKREIMDSR